MVIFKGVFRFAWVMSEKNKTHGDLMAAEDAGHAHARHTGPAEVEIKNMSVGEMQKKLEEALASLEEKQKALEEKDREAAN